MGSKASFTLLGNLKAKASPTPLLKIIVTIYPEGQISIKKSKKIGIKPNKIASNQTKTKQKPKVPKQQPNSM